MSNTVLVIDDDRSVVDDLDYFLSREGFFVKGISKSSEAYEALSKRINADCIVLDIMMRRPAEASDIGEGQETGEYLYGVIRRENSKIPVVVLSAKDRSEIGIDFISDNVFYVKKPYSERAKDVVCAIREALRK